jgi:SAM-dependent methyltransferase
MFGHVARSYARFRPDYPDELMAWIADAAPRRGLAWDCATGTGQAARGLARHFAHVAASDVDPDQIRAATPTTGITYFVSAAESSALGAGSVDAIAVAQALHWFDQDAFFAEAARVLAPGGVLVAWGYFLSRIAPAVDAVIYEYYEGVLGAHWSSRTRLLASGYATVALPFRLLNPPHFRISARWDLESLAGYLATWSAVQKYREEKGQDPFDVIRARLVAAWGDPASKRDVSWPLHIVAGRV